MFFNEQTTQDDVQLEPVYRIKEGIKQKQIRDNIRQALEDVTIHEWLSDDLRKVQIRNIRIHPPHITSS